MDCCICTDEAITILKYTGRLGKKITEPRCKSCANAVRENQSNTIHTETIIRDENRRDENKNTPRPTPPHLLTGGDS